ncbi:MAG: adenosylhomocysteinase [Desulfobacterales bacterium]|nr:adenosylhomocysteinase [Desulfobacterales bacterium]
MDIKDKKLAERGKLRIDWAAHSMPVLRSIRERFSREKPLSDMRISACLHVTTETAFLMQTLKDGGADVRLCASNPLSTQDDVAASLAVHDAMEVFAVRGEDRDTYYRHIHAALDHQPQITMDDGADLVGTLHSDRRELLSGVEGGTEETTTGVIRLKSMAQSRVLEYPIVAVNNADTKHLFDNRYGTGQSTIDGIVRATNRLLAGSFFVVGGYGWCGRGLAARASGMGARVIVTEVDPVRALEAAMDGYQILPMREAAEIGDFFCTVTGDIGVVRKEHFELMKNGAIVCNSGHFNVELDLEALEDMSAGRKTIRESLEEFRLPDGRRIYLLGEGRLVNLAAAEGHPSSVMDMSFANQALAAEYLVENASTLEREVYDVPREIDRKIATLKLETMDISIDTLTQAQEKYLNAWEMGT